MDILDKPSILDKLGSEIKSAMKIKDLETVSVLRFLHSQIKNKEIELRPDKLQTKDIIQVIRKLISNQSSALGQFQAGGRDDLVKKTKNELQILKTFLPPELSRDQLLSLVKEAISESSATSARDLGKVISLVSKKTNGLADNKLIVSLAKEVFSGAN